MRDLGGVGEWCSATQVESKCSRSLPGLGQRGLARDMIVSVVLPKRNTQHSRGEFHHQSGTPCFPTLQPPDHPSSVIEAELSIA